MPVSDVSVVPPEPESIRNCAASTFTSLLSVMVGPTAWTFAPVPVSSVSAAAKFAEDGVARNVATLAARPLIPVETGSPVQFVKTPEDGVPRAGVTRTGDVARTTLPVPVLAVQTGV